MGSNWSQVAELFEAAMELKPADRSSFLQKACGADAALLAEVEALLAHSTDGTHMLDQAVGRAVASYDGADSLSPGESVGPYRILAEIGRGGMGAVYSAVRTDDEFHRQVAIKIVKRGMDTDFILARFRRERQILAGLKHPNIAQLYDGGSTRDGRPYLIMEFVEGLPIAEYCDRNGLQSADRLRLFLKVCGAVQAAHRSLVVHRDLKPSNILVDTHGEPKLLDFGIAKLLDENAVEETAALTRTSVRLLTPDYASPEQVRGDNITTSTDIYSLGAVLYFLLTGKSAHRTQGVAASEWERWILEVEPDRPSAAAPERGIQPDLDNIVLKALRKEPDRRYADIGEFSADIENFLHDRPVSARPDTIRYRAAKFVRRNRLAVAAAALGALGLIAGAALAVHQARVAQANAERADRRFEQVRRLARTLLFDIHDKVRALPGATEAREIIVRTSLEYLDNLSTDAAGDIGLMTELSQAYLRVADIQGGQFRANLGKTAEARASLDKAIQLAEQVEQKAPDDRGTLEMLLRLYLQVSNAEAKDGMPPGEFIRRALAIGDRLAPLAANEPRLYNVLSSLHTHAYGRYLQSDYPTAARHARLSLENALKADAALPGASLMDLYSGHMRFGRVENRNGYPEKARDLFTKAAAVLDRIAQREPHNTIARRDRALLYQQHSRAFASPFNPNGPDWNSAYAKISEALAIVRELEATDTGNVLRFFDRSNIELESALLMIRIDPRKAFPHALASRKAIAEYIKLDPDHLYAKIVPPEIDNEMSRAYLTLGQFAEANAALTRALDFRAKRPVLRNSDLFSRRALARIGVGDFTGADRDTRHVAAEFARTDFAKQESADLVRYAEVELQIAQVQRALARRGNTADHQTLARQAIDRRRKLFEELRSRGFSTPYFQRLAEQQ